MIQIYPGDGGEKQQPSRQAEHTVLPPQHTPTVVGIHLLFYLTWYRPHVGCQEELNFTRAFAEVLDQRFVMLWC